MQSRLLLSLVKAVHCGPKEPGREAWGHIARLVSCCYSRSSRSVWLSAIGYWPSAKRFSGLLVSESVSDVAISNPTTGELDKKSRRTYPCNLFGLLTCHLVFPRCWNRLMICPETSGGLGSPTPANFSGI